MTKVTTLGQFIIEKQTEFPNAKGKFSRLLRDISLAAKFVNREVNKAGLADVLGLTGKTNVQGEDVKKLDVLANEEFINALRSGGECCVVASEENGGIVPMYDEYSREAEYVVCMDPLDGSSNIDVNASIGTIFSIYKRVSRYGGPGTEEDCLQPGNRQLAAGYVIYGSSTMIVYTTGNGVNGFTFDPSIGEFCLSHPNIRIPNNGNTYSVNEGHYKEFPDAIKQYIKYCQEDDVTTGRPYTSRYIGAMAADMHRSLIKGGIYLYPSSTKYKDGKIRLIYEGNPFAFIVEQAGGKATTGTERILDICPTSIHQRIPVIMGSPEMVDKVVGFIKKEIKIEV